MYQCHEGGSYYPIGRSYTIYLSVFAEKANVTRTTAASRTQLPNILVSKALAARKNKCLVKDSVPPRVWRTDYTDLI